MDLGIKGKVALVMASSRGLGQAMAVSLAKEGVKVAVAGRSPEGLKRSVELIEAVGGVAIALNWDLSDHSVIDGLVSRVEQELGPIDILINNASAINLTPTEATPAKRFDLMFDVNVRGTFLTSQAAIPFLRESANAGRNPHILTLSPPLSMKAKWFQHHVAYTMAKYGMSMCVLGMSEEFRKTGIAVNGLWPRTAIDTAALQMIPGIDTAACRTPEILADAAYVILNRVSKDCTGNFFVDDEVLASVGVTNLEKYSVVPGTTDFLLDFFLD
jgi:citronellol/citronellal dehydrogenase